MKIFIGIVLIYIIIVLSSAALMRYIWNAGYKGTEHEETWGSSIKRFSVAYLVTGSILGLVLAIFHFTLK